MSMSPVEVRKQVMDYLESTECTILEASPLHVTVKLSPRADRMLTERPYYWGFVERTGVDPETLSFTFVFDPEKYDALAAQAAAAPPPRAAGRAAAAATAPGGGALPPGVSADPQDSILARYFGIVPALPRIGPGMIRREDVTYGSKRLRQIWAAARDEGKCLQLFEDPGLRQRTTLFSAAYEPWLAVCYKVEMSCDLKREELHFIGVSLTSGLIVPDFEARLAKRELTPRLPENIHIQPSELSISAGADRLEGYLTSKLALIDYTWAEEARERLELELGIVDMYYAELLKEPDEEKRLATEEQYNRRRQETSWQYEPQIAVSAVTYGLFHLRST
ncbi:YqhG family protein [Paenibacillus sp. MMS20-IR301]|uniref:YqhG family protein n=1 Tax=Paenibacillus sp. MMS20-IR301 TaxID=2895946 RepID=UPI0028E7747B|nr:YqhG family protein [Paenibacillus sp. MMS20-IR301]WNS46115.1 YqhG family protein [Paenibacillus sp. MMS20-IR301]